MEIICAAHARLRMRQRGVSEEEVAEVLLRPGTTWFDGRKNSTVVSGSIDGRILCVCVVGRFTSDRVIVKTCYWRDED